MALPPKTDVDAILSKLNHAIGRYSPDASLTGQASRAEIRELAKRLFLSTMTPADLGVQHCKDMAVLVTVRTVMKLGLLSNLPSDGSPISAMDLGKAAGVSPALLERMFRILIAVGFIDQVSAENGSVGGYKHSHFSRDYINPLQPCAASLFQGMYDEYFRSSIAFDDYLSGEFQAPIPEPQSILNNCYNWSNKKQGQSIWDTMASRPERMAVFVNAFAGLDVILPPIGNFYDFNQLATKGNATASVTTAETNDASSNGVEDDRAGVEIVDVGGGNGRVLVDILRASPDLDPKKCVLQDIEKVLAHTTEDVVGMGVRTQVIDYFQEQPVHGAKAYYLRYIMHDYADESATKILSIVARSMAPESKILIGEVIVPEHITESNIDATVFDQILLCIGGKERTAKNFEQILDAAGLELVTIHYVPGTVGGLVEGRLKR